MSKITIFPSHKSTAPLEHIPLDHFLERIKSGHYRADTERVRAESDQEKRKEIKVSLPAVTISGTFSKRNTSSLLQHSGFICIDFDIEVPREQLTSDPYTYALFTSVSARGVALIVKIDPTQHFPSFAFLQKYYYDQYGLVIDSAPQSVVSLRCVSYDPELFINPDSKISGTYKPKPPKHQSLPLVLNDDQIGQIVREITSRNIDLAPDYDSYVRLSMALAKGLGEGGRDYFHALCSQNEKYKQSEADKKFTNALKTSSKISIGTFFHMAKQAGITLPSSDNKPLAIAAMGKKSGRKKEDVARQLTEINHISPASAANIAEQVFSRDDITLKTLAADPEHMIESLIHFISYNYNLKRNVISQKIEIHRPDQPPLPITDQQINDIYLHARGAFNTPQINKDLVKSIVFSSTTPDYHPINEFITRHAKNHTTTGHIAALIAAINTPTPYADVFIRKWLVSLHAALDGHPVRLVLTLVGPQYNGKTEFFRRLLPKPLMPYYGESKLDRGKDDELLMCQKLIVMDDEMGGKSKHDEKRFKDMTSKDSFSLRAPYAAMNMDYKRLAVLCGTSNPSEVITDPTGNTRILPIHVESIDYAAMNAVDRTALFIEAHNAYKSGESIDITPEEIFQLKIISGDFASIPVEHELITQFFEVPGDYGHTDMLTATEIKIEIEINTKQQIRNMHRFGIILRNIFGKPKSVRRGGEVVKCYPTRKINGNTYPGSNGQSVVTTQKSQNIDSEELPF